MVSIRVKYTIRRAVETEMNPGKSGRGPEPDAVSAMPCGPFPIQIQTDQRRIFPNLRRKSGKGGKIDAAHPQRLRSFIPDRKDFRYHM